MRLMAEGLYTLRRLRLENILSHKSTSIEFSKGFTAIVGENGAGKSSIFEAILYALTPFDSPRGKSIISSGAHSGRISLTLENQLGGDDVDLSLMLTREQRSIKKKSALIRVGGRRITSTAKGYSGEIHRILGLRGIPDPASYIKKAIIVSQDGFAEIASTLASPADLRKLLDSALGMAVYEKAFKELGNVEIRIEGVSSTLSVGSAATLDGMRRAYIKARDRVLEARLAADEYRKEEKVLTRKVKSLKSELEKLESELRFVNSEIARVESDKDRLERLERERESILNHISRLRALLVQLEREKARIEKIRNEVQLLEAKLRLKSIVEEGEALASRISKLENEVKILEKVKADFEEVSRIPELELRLREIEEEYETTWKEYDSLQKELEEARLKVNQASRLMEDLARVGEKYCSKPCKIGVKELRARLEEELSSLDDRIAKYKEELERLQERAGYILSQAESMKDAVKVLEGSAGHGRCPVCGSPLRPERAEELVKHYLVEARRLEAEAAELTEKAYALRRELGSLEERREKLQSLLIEAKSLEHRLEEIGLESIEDLVSAQKRLETLEKRFRGLYMRLRELEKEKSLISSEIARLMGLKKSADSVLIGLGVREDSIGDALAEKRELLEESRRRAASIVEELGKSLGLNLGDRSLEQALSKARSELARAESILKKLLEESNRLEEVVGEVERVKAEIELFEGRLESVNREIEELASRVRRRGELVRRARELEAKIRELRKSYEDLMFKYSHAIAQAEKYMKEYDEGSKLLRLLLPALAAKRILMEVKDLSYEHVIPMLEDEINDLLSRFDLSISAVELREVVASRGSKGIELNVYNSEGGRVEASAISGGEKTALAISFIVALNKVVGSKLGFIALDEPTSNLDQPRREALVELLRAISEEGIVEQLIVITHHGDVRDYADVTCIVTRDQARGSVVRCGGDGLA